MSRKNIKVAILSSCIHGTAILDIPKTHIFLVKNVLVKSYLYFNNYCYVLKSVQILTNLEKFLEDKIKDAKENVELETGEGCLIPKAKLDAYKEVLEYVKRL